MVSRHDLNGCYVKLDRIMIELLLGSEIFKMLPTSVNLRSDIDHAQWRILHAPDRQPD